MIPKTIERRLSVDETSSSFFSSDTFVHLPSKIRQILFSRGIRAESDLSFVLKDLIPPEKLLHLHDAADLLFCCIKKKESILIVGDFDADGATSTALMMKSLKQLGATHFDFLVPDRFQYGYGLSLKLVNKAAELAPDLIVTVDNGIANHEGVARAKSLGIKVIITDHHLAAETLPEADVIVNPNQPNDTFPSKHLAGVGVAFYLMLALRRLMREKNWFVQQSIPEPNLAEHLDLVALGTVADVVQLDKNNRILVEQGLRRIRGGYACYGIQALLTVSKKKALTCQSMDLGFSAGPRLNAAGRLDDMRIGIHCLMALSLNDALKRAEQLNQLNHQRRAIEQTMVDDANRWLDKKFIDFQKKARPIALCLYDADWHQGVIGILASRIKEKINRPVIAFARENKESLWIKGSARSIQGIHIRDVLARIDTQHPKLISKFGGHAMAAGLTVYEKDFEYFCDRFQYYTTEHLQQKMGSQTISDAIETDGSLNNNDLSLHFAQQLQSIAPWGQGFQEPLFDDSFQLLSRRVMAEKHLKLLLKKEDEYFDAVYFFFDESIPLIINSSIHVVYKLAVNRFRGETNLQLIIEHISTNDVKK
jgi:single-stranded-DNA-specific exonuclease